MKYLGASEDNKDFIPKEMADAKYTKPSAGIPKTDLSSEVQDGLTKELFVCTYGTTTASQIQAALDAGKLPIVVKSPYTYIYTQTSGTAHYFMCTSIASSTGYIRRAGCNLSSSNWSTEEVANEKTGNKVTSITSSSTDTQYPSAKAVYTESQKAVPKSQGTAKAGQFLVVGSDGNVTTQAFSVLAGGSY